MDVGRGISAFYAIVIFVLAILCMINIFRIVLIFVCGIVIMCILIFSVLVLESSSLSALFLVTVVELLLLPLTRLFSSDFESLA